MGFDGRADAGSPQYIDVRFGFDASGLTGGFREREGGGEIPVLLCVCGLGMSLMYSALCTEIIDPNSA